MKASKNARAWLFYGAMLAIIACSELILVSEPAYAGSCTPTRCSQLQGFCMVWCVNHGGGYRATQCPWSGNPSDSLCICNAQNFIGPC